VRLGGADASTLAMLAEQASAHSHSVHSVSFSPDGTRIVSGSSLGMLELWGARCCSRCSRVSSWWRRVLQDVAECVCARLRGADGSTLALVAEHTWAHSADVWSVVFSPDGTKIVSGSSDSSIKLWGGRHSRAPSSRVLLRAATVWLSAAKVWVCCCAAQIRHWRWWLSG
jgi:WD40 repeat protein